MEHATFNWQRKEWPSFTFARSALKDELDSFACAFRAAKEAALREPEDPLIVARTLAAEAVTTSAIEGVEVDAAVVMSSICRALGVTGVPLSAAHDAASEGAARMVLSVREDWNAPLSAAPTMTRSTPPPNPSTGHRGPASLFPSSRSCSKDSSPPRGSSPPSATTSLATKTPSPSAPAR